jgi:hypothetical protein
LSAGKDRGMGGRNVIAQKGLCRDIPPGMIVSGEEEVVADELASVDRLQKQLAGSRRIKIHNSLKPASNVNVSRRIDTHRGAVILQLCVDQVRENEFMFRGDLAQENIRIVAVRMFWAQDQFSISRIKVPTSAESARRNQIVLVVECYSGTHHSK